MTAWETPVYVAFQSVNALTNASPAVVVPVKEAPVYLQKILAMASCDHACVLEPAAHAAYQEEKVQLSHLIPQQ